MVNGTCDSQMNLIYFLKAVILLENVLVLTLSHETKGQLAPDAIFYILL